MKSGFNSRILKTLLLSFFFVSTGFSQEAPDISILEKLSANPYTEGNYIQTKTIITQNGTRNLKASGTFCCCPEGILLSQEKPFRTDTVITESSLKIISSTGKVTETGSDSQTFSSMSSIMCRIFSGNPEGIDEYFQVTFKAENNLWSLTLKPEDQNVARALLEIFIRGSWLEDKASIQAFKITQNPQTSTSYEFLDIKHPKELSEKQKALFGLN